jgi:hypothetical protein
VNRAINAFLIGSDISPMIAIKDPEACQSFKLMGLSRELDWIIPQARRGSLARYRCKAQAFLL